MMADPTAALGTQEAKQVTYHVSVEEFIPRFNVQYMLQLTENVESLGPEAAKVAFVDLKRAMVWMERYIAPTSEFWEWTNGSFDIDAETTLHVQLIGFGWAVSVSSKKAHEASELEAEEARLIQILDKLTGHIPARAVLRMKSSGWTPRQLREVSKTIRAHGIGCRAEETALSLPALGVKIDAIPEERLECASVSRINSQAIEKVLSIIKQYANRTYEGAGWCAYQRRRLTVVHKIGLEEITPQDREFLRQPGYGMPGEVLASRVAASGRHLATLCSAPQILDRRLRG
jgi:hypothetical protein